MPQALLLTIRDMYVSMLPIVFGGVLNMIFVKTPVYKMHCAPIDRGQLWRDGKRIFGDNKTWIGFWSMVFFCMVSQVFWGWVCNRSGWNNIHDLYRVRENTLVLNVLTGTLYGLAYALFELPNSFLKRRVDIRPGKTERSVIGAVFFVVDQIDSLIGVMLVLMAFSGISFGRYLGYLALGAGTHILVNLILYLLHIRKNL